MHSKHILLTVSYFEVRQKCVRVDLQVVECNDNFFEDKQGKERRHHL